MAARDLARAAQVVVDLSRAAAIADMRPSRLAVIGGILQASPPARLPVRTQVHS